MSAVTNEPGRCGFNAADTEDALVISGWNHDPASDDCICVEWGLTGCTCDYCHSLRRMQGFCAVPGCPDCSDEAAIRLDAEVEGVEQPGERLGD